MDRLTRFPTATGQVEVVSKSGNTLDNVISNLEKLINQVRLLRAGHEEWTWGDLVEDSSINLDELNLIAEDEHE